MAALTDAELWRVVDALWRQGRLELIPLWGTFVVSAQDPTAPRESWVVEGSSPAECIERVKERIR